MMIQKLAPRIIRLITTLCSHFSGISIMATPIPMAADNPTPAGSALADTQERLDVPRASFREHARVHWCAPASAEWSSTVS
eukprot:4656385-Pyramimonas_sp.AAC.1